jgi:hypothetical protein
LFATFLLLTALYCILLIPLYRCLLPEFVKVSFKSMLLLII